MGANDSTGKAGEPGAAHRTRRRAHSR